MGLKIRESQKENLKSLLDVHTQFQLPSSIRRGGECEKQTFFKVKKRKPLISPLLIDLGG